MTVPPAIMADAGHGTTIQSRVENTERTERKGRKGEGIVPGLSQADISVYGNHLA